MNHRGLGAALAGWAQLIGRREFWLAAFVLMAIDGLQGHLWGQTTTDLSAARSAVWLSKLTAVFGLVSFLVSAAIQFSLARRIGDDDAGVWPAAVAKWVALLLASTLISIGVNVSLPVLLAQSEAGLEAFVYASPAAQLAIAVALLPIAVRLVAAAHSGNRVRIGAVTRFLGNNALSWFGGQVLLLVGLIAVGYGADFLGGMIGDRSVSLLISGLMNGFCSALLILWPIAAYRAMICSQNLAKTTS